LWGLRWTLWHQDWGFLCGIFGGLCGRKIGAFYVGFVVDSVAPRLVILYLQPCSAAGTIHTNAHYFYPLLGRRTVGPLEH